jgi:hypothetical protein
VLTYKVDLSNRPPCGFLQCHYRDLRKKCLVGWLALPLLICIYPFKRSVFIPRAPSADGLLCLSFFKNYDIILVLQKRFLRIPLNRIPLRRILLEVFLLEVFLLELESSSKYLLEVFLLEVFLLEVESSSKYLLEVFLLELFLLEPKRRNGIFLFIR